MEIFFLKKIKSKTLKRFSIALFCLVFISVAVSQCVIFLKGYMAKQTVSVIKAEGANSFFEITNGDFAGVKVYLNGEEAAEFMSDTLRLYVCEDSVVEIFSPYDTEINMQISLVGDGAEFVAKSDCILCPKGLSYAGKIIV